jgi:hypothetical protein
MLKLASQWLLLPALIAATPAAAGEAPSAIDFIDRVPAQRVGDPFATITLGAEISTLFPAASSWDLPLGGGRFAAVSPQPLSQVALHVGGLHFFGHAEINVTIPVYGLSTALSGPGGTRSAQALYNFAVGLKYYPWALRPGTIRPFLQTGLMDRTLFLADGPDVSGNATGNSRWILPVGVGVGWRTPWHFIIDVSAQYQGGDVTSLSSGLTAQPLGQPVQASYGRLVDLRGVRTTLGLKANFDATPGIVVEGFRERAAERLAKMAQRGTLNAFYVAAGPSSVLQSNGSSYFADDRPYLRGVYALSLFPHLTAGYYHFGTDLDFRVAYREFGGSAQAYGASLSTYQRGAFVEALKIFDVHLYGFAPFIGLGAGYEWRQLTDTAAGTRTALSNGGPVLSVPIGWDIRIDPTDCWFLRTNLRWVPRSPLSLPDGHAFDYGGLEFDFIQLVFFPERLIWRVK